MKELGYYWLFEEGRVNCDTGETNASSNLARVLIVMEEMMQCKLNALFSNSSDYNHVVTPNRTQQIPGGGSSYFSQLLQIFTMKTNTAGVMRKFTLRYKLPQSEETTEYTATPPWPC